MRFAFALLPLALALGACQARDGAPHLATMPVRIAAHGADRATLAFSFEPPVRSARTFELSVIERMAARRARRFAAREAARRGATAFRIERVDVVTNAQVGDAQVVNGAAAAILVTVRAAAAFSNLAPDGAKWLDPQGFL